MVDRVPGQDPYETAFLMTPLGMSIISPGRHMLQVNPALCRLLGRSAGELVGMQADEFTHPDDLNVHTVAHERLLAGEIDDYQVEKRYLRPDGSVIWAALHVAAVRDQTGRAVALVSQVHDITAQVRHRERLSWNASHDALTGLASRRLLFDVVEKSLTGGRGTDRCNGLVYIDLDGFKTVNDTYGHEVGDQLLVETARRIRRVVRSHDTVARMGGDEFVVHLDGIDRAADAKLVAEVVRAELEATVRLPGNGDEVLVDLTASVGVAVASAVDADELLRRADAAMYVAKRTGRNRVVPAD